VFITNTFIVKTNFVEIKSIGTTIAISRAVETSAHNINFMQFIDLLTNAHIPDAVFISVDICLAFAAITAIIKYVILTKLSFF
jgi:hypothetical protein